MSEETTHNLPDRRSFEERVFARFDALDARMARMESRLDNVETRLQTLESESERRNVETKPLWERALAEIAAISQKLDALSEKVDSIEYKLSAVVLEMNSLRANQLRLEKRMDKLEGKPAT